MSITQKIQEAARQLMADKDTGFVYTDKLVVRVDHYCPDDRMVMGNGWGHYHGQSAHKNLKPFLKEGLCDFSHTIKKCIHTDMYYNNDIAYGEPYVLTSCEEQDGVYVHSYAVYGYTKLGAIGVQVIPGLQVTWEPGRGLELDSNKLGYWVAEKLEISV